VCGVGEGEDDGVCIPGMLSILGVGEGDAFGAGDGIGIEWPVCWAIAGAIAINKMPVTSNNRRIMDSTGLSM